MSTMFYRVFQACNDVDDDILSPYIMNSTLLSLKKFTNVYKPKKIILVFDESGSWRKQYTEESVLSGKIYKAHRRMNLTPKERFRHDILKKDCIPTLRTALEKYTKMVVMSKALLEADDIIAHFVKMHPNDKKTLITRDKDLLQLLFDNNLSIIDPVLAKKIDLSDYNNDVEYFLFRKCIRGDTSDNIQSACPNIKTKTILEAYTDPYKRTNLMNKVWKNKDGNEMIVGEIFKENEILIDIFKAPDVVQQQTVNLIKREMEKKRKMNYLGFVAFLKRSNLQKMFEESDKFISMLNIG